MPDMVMDSAAGFEARAIALAGDRPALAAIRARLAAGLAAGALFDTPRYARNLEGAFRAMRDRHRSGEPPAAFAAADLPAP